MSATDPKRTSSFTRQRLNRALACVTEWNESEPDKGYKLIECACRCVDIPENPAAPKSSGDA